MLYKNLFQLYPDNFQNNYFLLSDKLEDIRYISEEEALKKEELRNNGPPDTNCQSQ